VCGDSMKRLGRRRDHLLPVNKFVQIELELQQLRRRALTEAPITEDDLAIVERCARALGVKLTDDQWVEVWPLLRQGVSPYSVLAELGIVDPRRES
jgi:hypothetical protein